MTLIEVVRDDSVRAIQGMERQNELIRSGMMRPGHKELTANGIIEVDDTESAIANNEKWIAKRRALLLRYQ